MSHIEGFSRSPGGKNISDGLRYTESDATPRLTKALSLRSIPNGTVVEGMVLDARSGIFLVRIAGHELQAQATMPLLVGQRFRAVWDGSGQTPLLRLCEQDMALLGALPESQRSLATALLLRGLPLSQDVVTLLRFVWGQMGSKEAYIAPLVELWARGSTLTPKNVSLLIWYVGLSPEMSSQLWKNIRRRFREELQHGRSPSEALRRLRDEEGDIGRFVEAHSLLSQPARQGIDPTLLMPTWWPFSDQEDELPAHVRVEKKQGKDGRSFWRVAFDMPTRRLGRLTGEVVTEGSQLGVSIRTENFLTLRLLQRKKTGLHEKLEELNLHVQYITVCEEEKEKEKELLPRRLDIEA
ncbi:MULTISPECIES: flagellar hook-length control protein FliK [Aminobacterium]|jgi:hypothetical protein|uniref:flagellar hook-length control protein FliK n=1 Tax=Aminobacterium TaxID=81466 RepID=UPI000463F2B6|nr:MULTISPECIES: flagellar hook-length control protein FliK [Aminobacterium]